MNSHKSTSMPKAFTVWSYAFCLTLFLSANTLYGVVNSTAVILNLITVCLVALLFFICWMKVRIDRTLLERWLVWTVFLAVTYTLIELLSGRTGGMRYIVFFYLLALLPFCVYLMKRKKLYASFIIIFVNLVFIFAVFAFALWIIGPVSGILSPNCSIATTWGSNEYIVTRQGYFGLLYLTQVIDLSGITIARNTSIFAEAPMYSMILVIAVCFELFVSKSRRRIVLITLTASIISTFSTGGFILLLLCLYFGYVKQKVTSASGSLSRLLLTVAILVFGFLIYFYLFGEKLDSTSGQTHLDDYVAGLQAWIGSPLIGYGFGGGDTVIQFMGSFRSNNLGFSNSPMDVLVRGGVLFMSVFVVSFIGLLSQKDSYQDKYIAIIFIAMWCLVIVTSLPITALWMSLGLEMLIFEDNVKRSA